jgi:hypothetical protein
MLTRAYFALVLCLLAGATNPIGEIGIADPHVHRFVYGSEAAFYAYATHDFSKNNSGFRMDDWWIWASSDLVNWSKAAVLPPANTSSSAPTECWATDAAFSQGFYYWYLSMGNDEIGVVRGLSPVGPWVDPLGAPLVNSSWSHALGTEMRDPCAFVDDDGTAYLIAGTFKYYIAALNEDMISFAEPFRSLRVLNPTGPYGNSTDDKPFVHKANGVYYLSWGCFYGISASVYGPYEYMGSMVMTASIDPAFRLNQTSAHWYDNEDLADRHGSFWHADGQWFWSGNDRSHSTDLRDRSVFRDTVLAYVHYYNNGTIAPVVINALGVGAYDGALVEAENAMKIIGPARKTHDASGSFALYNITAATRLHYPNVALNGGRTLRVRYGAKTACALTASDGRRELAGGLLPATSFEPSGEPAWALASFAIEGIDSSTASTDIVLTFFGRDIDVAIDNFSIV